VRAALLTDLAGSYSHRRDALRREAQRVISPLHPRELEVLQLIARGDSTKSIAITLGIARTTAQKHVANISAKTQVHGLVKLANLAIRSGLTSVWAASLMESRPSRR